MTTAKFTDRRERKKAKEREKARARERKRERERERGREREGSTCIAGLVGEDPNIRFQHNQQ